MQIKAHSMGKLKLYHSPFNMLVSQAVIIIKILLEST